MIPLADFLRESREYFFRHNEQELDTPLLVIAGNESGDLDSIISAILYAYLRTYAREDFPCVPLLNFPREDIDIRPELSFLSETFNIDKSTLLCLSDLPSPEVLPPESIELILVDHNMPTGHLWDFYEESVIGTIDHHDDEGYIEESDEVDGVNREATDDESAPEPRVLRNCYSCTSLVVQRFMHLRTFNNKRKLGFQDLVGLEIAKFALVAILIDNSNDLQPKEPPDSVIGRHCNPTMAQYSETLMSCERSKLLDSEVLFELLEVIRREEILCPKFDRKEFYDSFLAAKLGIQGMKPRDILRKDYKQWEDDGWDGMKLGISSITVSSSQVELESLIKTLDMQNFINERDLFVYAIMTTTVADKGPPARELTILTKHEGGVELVALFNDLATMELDLCEIMSQALHHSDGRDSLLYTSWAIRNVNKTRKAVAPLLRRTITDYLKGDSTVQE